MFSSEELGLMEISRSKKIATPQVLARGHFDGAHYLVMQYIESGSTSNEGFKRLGCDLANMHQYTEKSFGWKYNNFIGILPQSNDESSDWVRFFVYQRLKPQLALARAKRWLDSALIPECYTMLHRFKNLCPDVVPSLLHGDLWSGNILIDRERKPYLIDPSVYYGHSEVDIAMTQLFGGFSTDFYGAYHEVVPREEESDARIDIYQLYYLLVHLNLFGTSYRPSVVRILKRYFL